MNVSEFITNYLIHEGVRHVFGIPGGYVVPLVSEIHNTDGIDFVLSAHEGGAAYMAQGYSQVTRKFGVVVTTAGPAALNSLTGLAQAASDGDPVLLVHGTVPENKTHLGANQDTFNFECDIAEVIRGLTVCQKIIMDVESFLDDFEDAHRQLTESQRLRRGGPVHLQIGTNVFSESLRNASGSDEVDFSPQPTSYRPVSGNTLQDDVAEVLRILQRAERPVVLVGNGIHQANASAEIMDLVTLLGAPLITTAKGVACVDHRSPLFLGQYSIFPNLRPVKWLEEQDVDVILAIGTSLNEYGSNSFSDLVKRSHIVHTDKNPHVFGRGVGQGVEPERRTYIEQELRAFVVELSARVAEEPARYSHLNQESRLRAFHQRFPENLSRAEETLEDDTKLTGQRVVHELSKSLAHIPRLNIVADTGASKLYVSHYVDYQPGWQVFQPGVFDTMGYAVSAAIGVTLGARDLEGDEAPITVCVVGDGSLYMNNELSCVASNIDSPLLIFVLNDYRLSTVYQGFAAVNEQLLTRELEFSCPVDLEKLVQAQGLECAVVEKPNQISRSFIDALVAKGGPVVVDCRIERTTFGPGVERYNAVRAMLGRDTLTVAEMSEILLGIDKTKAGVA